MEKVNDIGNVSNNNNHSNDNNNNNKLYNWNFTDIYEDLDEGFRSDISKAKELTKELLGFKGKLNDLDNILSLLELDTELSKLLENAGCYIFLKYNQNMLDNDVKRLYDEFSNISSEISKELSFVEPELLQNDSAFLDSILADERFAKYKISLERLFKEKRYVLSASEEKVLSAVMPRVSNEGIYDILTNLEMDLGNVLDSNGKEHPLTNATYATCMESEDRTLRKNAYNRMYERYMKHNKSLSEMYINELMTTISELRLRGYKSYLSCSTIGDGVSEKVYDTLVSEVDKGLLVNQRALDVKRKMCGFFKDDYTMYDVYYNPFKGSENISFEEGKEMVLSALKPLGDNYISSLENAFKSSWLDVFPKEGKMSGAFSMGIYHVHPYVLLNHMGTLDDVSTIAHEMGHAMHSYLSSKKQSYEVPDYTIMVAEVASTVNEILFAEYNIRNEKDDKKKAKLLFDLIDRIRATLFRQTMFAEFERHVIESLENNEVLTSEDLNNYYIGLVKKYFGDEVIIDDNIMYEWSRIPHFYTPYYVYKYAVGISSAIYIVSNILDGYDEYVSKYISMLESGGSKLSQDTLKIADVDIADSKLYENAIKYMDEKITELEKLI